MKILNLYAGIGGNRKLWVGHEITAVELNPQIAAIYQDFFPNDRVIVGDAHQYLLDHFKKFDFIWSSPPCPTHSRMNHMKHMPDRYPDMKLHQEVYFLKHFFGGLYVVENVKSYYEPPLKPVEMNKHYFWSNFYILKFEDDRKVRNDKGCTLEWKMKERGIIVDDFHAYDGDKRTLINNCVQPELGLHILNTAIGAIPPIQEGLFA